MESILSSPILIFFLVINALFPLALLYLYLRAFYTRVYKRVGSDKAGRSWIRIIAQLLISLPFFPILLGGYNILMQATLEPYRQGCTSGPAMGDCFGHGILIAISGPISIIAFAIGLALYRFATDNDGVSR